MFSGDIKRDQWYIKNIRELLGHEMDTAQNLIDHQIQIGSQQDKSRFLKMERVIYPRLHIFVGQKMRGTV